MTEMKVRKCRYVDKPCTDQDTIKWAGEDCKEKCYPTVESGCEEADTNSVLTQKTSRRSTP